MKYKIVNHWSPCHLPLAIVHHTLAKSSIFENEIIFIYSKLSMLHHQKYSQLDEGHLALSVSQLTSQLSLEGTPPLFAPKAEGVHL